MPGPMSVLLTAQGLGFVIILEGLVATLTRRRKKAPPVSASPSMSECQPVFGFGPPPVLACPMPGHLLAVLVFAEGQLQRRLDVSDLPVSPQKLSAVVSLRCAGFWSQGPPFGCLLYLTVTPRPQCFARYPCAACSRYHSPTAGWVRRLLVSVH